MGTTGPAALDSDDTRVMARSFVVDGDTRPAHMEPAPDSPAQYRGINRTQGLVLGFLVLAWVTLAASLILSQPVREVTLRGMPGTGPPATSAFLVGLSGFLTVLGIGVVRRWRWLFWLLLGAFAVGLARVPVAVLQLSGGMSAAGPDWYVVLQGVSGVVQAGLAIAMFAGYRRAGPWGPC